MTVATIGADGVPDARIVLVRAADERGLVFFTNYEGAKSRQLDVLTGGRGGLLLARPPSAGTRAGPRRARVRRRERRLLRISATVEPARCLGIAAERDHRRPVVPRRSDRRPRAAVSTASTSHARPTGVAGGCCRSSGSSGRVVRAASTTDSATAASAPTWHIDRLAPVSDRHPEIAGSTSRYPARTATISGFEGSRWPGRGGFDEAVDEGEGVRGEARALPVPPHGARATDPRREFDLDATDRVAGSPDCRGCKPAELSGDRVQVGDHVVGGQMTTEGRADVVRQRSVATADQQRSEQTALAEAVDRDDHVDVGRGTPPAPATPPDGPWSTARCSRMPSGWITAYSDAPDRSAAARGDHIGHRLERTAVVRHEPERATQFDDLLDTGCRQADRRTASCHP